MKRTQSQNKQIWGRVAKLGRKSGLGKEWAEGIMRLILKEITGAESTANITPPQAQKLIAELNQRILSIKPAPDDAATVTKKQQEVLQHLMADVGIVSPKGFCQRIIKAPWPQTRRDAIKVHQALSAMLIKKVDYLEAKRMLRSIDGEALNDWERIFMADIEGFVAAGGALRLSAGQAGKFLEIYKKHRCERSVRLKRSVS